MISVSGWGVEGHLIYTASGKYMFRVYKENFEFTDYELLHSDLCVTITDEDATFYSDDEGNRLDHNPATLGRQPQEQYIGC
jgi:hypothetical protein